MTPSKERGRPIWVSAPVARQLDALLRAQMEERERLVTMSEVIEGLLAGRKPVQP